MLNEFEAPIPGQSLAGGELGTYPWENPPDFASPDEAFAAFINRIMEDDEMLHDISRLLDLGTSPEAITEGILFNAFTIGQITPDVSILLREPLRDLIVLVGEESGVNVQSEDPTVAALEEQIAQELFAEDILSEEEDMQEAGLDETMLADEPPVPAEEKMPAGLMALPPEQMTEEQIDG